MINYAHWTIVSPESSLIDVGADGYIAVVWTGTARTPNLYEGRRKERTFETAFLEYGAMQIRSAYLLMALLSSDILSIVTKDASPEFEKISPESLRSTPRGAPVATSHKRTVPSR